MSVGGSGGVSVGGSGGVSLDGSGGVSVDGSGGVSVDGSGGMSVNGSGGVSVGGSGGVSVSLDGSEGVSVNGFCFLYIYPHNVRLVLLVKCFFCLPTIHTYTGTHTHNVRIYIHTVLFLYSVCLKSTSCTVQLLVCIIPTCRD